MPAFSSMYWSRSMNSLSRSLASLRPMLVLPLPIKPHSTIFPCKALPPLTERPGPAPPGRPRHSCRMSWGWKAVPYQASWAATAWYTSISMPPTVTTPASPARRRSSVWAGLYTASNTAWHRAATAPVTGLCPAWGYMPTLVAFKSRSYLRLGDPAPAQPLQLLVGLHLDTEPPVPALPEEAGHLLGQCHGLGLGGGPAGDGQVRVVPALGDLEGQGPGGAPVAQKQHPAREVQAVVFQGLAAAGAVGGVTGETAALHPDGVYRAEPGGPGVHRVQKGQDGLLVGDGDVKAVQLPQPGQGPRPGPAGPAPGTPWGCPKAGTAASG